MWPPIFQPCQHGPLTKPSNELTIKNQSTVTYVFEADVGRLPPRIFPRNTCRGFFLAKEATDIRSHLVRLHTLTGGGLEAAFRPPARGPVGTQMGFDSSHLENVVVRAES